MMSDLAAGIVLWFTTDSGQQQETENPTIYHDYKEYDTTFTNTNRFSTEQTPA